MVTYTYSLSSNFGGVINSSNLHSEIVSANLGQILKGVEVSDDVVIIIFDGVLSTENQTLLDGIVSSHDGNVLSEGTQFQNIIINDPIVDSSIYSSVATFIFQGTDILGPSIYFKMISFMLEGGTSYDVKIINISSNSIIYLEQNYTNTDPQIINLGQATNLPSGPCIFDLQIRTNSSVVHIKTITMYYI